MILRAHIPSPDDPITPRFWFVMSIALLAGFVFAYPMNWWLVANHLKHDCFYVPSVVTHACAQRQAAAAACESRYPPTHCAASND